MGELSGVVGTADVSTKYSSVDKLTLQYFSFKTFRLLPKM